jgi:hypothetical protein
LAKNKIDLHKQDLINFSEKYFEDLKSKRIKILDHLAKVENEINSKEEFIEDLINQIKVKKQGQLVEEKMDEIEKVKKWVIKQNLDLENWNSSENLKQQISMDANLFVKNPTDLQETIFETSELISTSIIFFGDFNQIIGYRPDINYWFNARADMDLTSSDKQFSFMDGLNASLIFHDKIIFTGEKCWEIKVNVKAGFLQTKFGNLQSRPNTLNF